MIVSAEAKEDAIEAQVVTGCPEFTRVHAIALQFIPPGTVDQLCQEFNRTLR
jgi:hypothetical protein